MKNLNRLSLLVSFLVFITSCTKDDVDGIVEIASKTYQLQPTNGNNVSGTARFINNSNGTISVELNLTGTSSSATLPAHIHSNTAAETGPISITLVSTSGATGESVSTFNIKDDGTQITYQQLLNMDGYLAIHADTNNSQVVATVDIGQNELTQNTTSYTLQEADLTGVTGNVTFTERINGEALATFNLSGLPSGGSHPAYIFTGDLANAPGNLLFTFNNIDGTTGIGYSNIDQDENGNPLLYQDLLTLDAYVDVVLSESTTNYHLAQGNIGAN